MMGSGRGDAEMQRLTANLAKKAVGK